MLISWFLIVRIQIDIRNMSNKSFKMDRRKSLKYDIIVKKNNKKYTFITLLHRVLKRCIL